MNNDVIFRAYVTNLGRYNEGQLTGEWVDFPIENNGVTIQESIDKILHRIGVDGKEYEEYFITDYDSEIEGLTGCMGEYENLYLLQFLSSKIQEMNCTTEQLEAMLEFGESTGSVMELINLVCNTDCFYYLQDVHNDYELGYEYVKNCGLFSEKLESIGMLRDYIDYESYGRDVRIMEGGIHTENGYISLVDSITEYYDSTVEISDMY